MIVLIDNYDSFSYNLYQLIGGIRPDITVIRNDQKTAEEIAAMKPEAIVLSPGPGRPADAGICIDVIQTLKDSVPILGVCLGHQAICEAFGGTITYAPQLMHGKSSVVEVDLQSRLFHNMTAAMTVARYHSLIADRNRMPECLKITATAADGTVMAVEHREYPVFGVQFHPESILTADGETIIKNFIHA